MGSNYGAEEEDCREEGCTRVKHANGLCYAHYQQNRKTGILTPIPPVPVVICQESECSRRVKSKGRCATHYSEYRLSRTAECSFDGCNRNVNGLGLCSTHNAQRRAGKDLTPIRSWGTYTKGVECLIPGCSNAARGHSGCPRHRSMATKYSLTVEQISALPAACEVCGETKRLAIDHDHSCCSGTSSCGKCVRGVLCSWCNVTLGYAKEDISRLEGLIEYLKINRKEEE